MAFFDFLKKLVAPGEDKSETFRCAKCGKEKEKPQGVFVAGGSDYCCKQCCDTSGNPADGTCQHC